MILKRIGLKKAPTKEELLQKNVNSIGIVVTHLDRNGRVVRSNRFRTAGAGMPPDNMIGKTASAIFPPDDVNKFTAEEMEVINTGNPKFGIIGQYTSPVTGTSRMFRTDIIPRYDGNMHVIGATLFSLDITEQIEAEEALSESETRYRAVVEWSSDGIVAVSGDIVVFVNRKALEMFGYEKSRDLLGKRFQTYVHSKDTKRIWRGYHDMQSGLAEYPRFEFTGICSGGEEIEIEASSTVVYTGGQPTVLLFLRDITERKRSEQERAQLIAELQNALSQVKALSGLLPICSNCKKIRNDEGSWEQIESYITHRSEAAFSHGICPECTERLYPEFYRKHHDKSREPKP